ncbi:MAG: glycosyltransferase family 39 protein [Candidatus Levybacteria bacterium]|nr:glycosyltransferase family 39 protein [Candidatus Levybacteria bacterium]
MKKIEIIFLTLILVGAFLTRLYHFSWPVADWHSWRQVDTSAVSRNFIKNGFDLLHPKFEDLSFAVSLKDNPQGYRFVEFPIYNVAQAGLFKLVGIFTLEEWGRLVTIFSCLISIIFLYLLVAKYTNNRAGLLAAFFFAFIPYNIYYGRTILPDQSMVAALLAGTYFFSNWIDAGIRYQVLSIKYWIWFIFAVIFIAVALLLKPYALFFTLPLIYLAWNRFGFGFLKKWQLWLFIILVTLPLGSWRIWMSQKEFLPGIPRNDWLFNGNHIRFKGAFFQWLFADRIGRLILGYWGLPFFVLGILKKINKKENWFFFYFLISSLTFMTVIATGNIQHDYYQILIMPTLAIFLAKGVDLIIEKTEIFNYWVSRLMIIVGIIFMLAFGWFAVRDYYSIQHPNIIIAGQMVDELTPKDAKIIASYGADTTFLYYANRQGWPVFDRSFKAFRKAGASYIAFADPTPEELNLETLFKPVIITPTYAIFDLTKPTPEGLVALKKN